MAVIGCFSNFGAPTVVDSTLHNGPVIGIDPPNKEHLNVVFNGDVLGVVDP